MSAFHIRHAQCVCHECGKTVTEGYIVADKFVCVACLTPEPQKVFAAETERQTKLQFGRKP